MYTLQFRENKTENHEDWKFWSGCPKLDSIEDAIKVMEVENRAAGKRWEHRIVEWNSMDSKKLSTQRILTV